MPTTGAPLGTPLGAGIPISASIPATDTALSRYIDPNTGEYAIDSTTGVYQTMPSTRQRVMLALITELGSVSIDREFGYLRPRKIGARFEQQVKDSVRSALLQLTDIEKIVRIDNITIDRTGQSRAEVTVKYTDLSTGDADEVAV